MSCLVTISICSSEATFFYCQCSPFIIFLLFSGYNYVHILCSFLFDYYSFLNEVGSSKALFIANSCRKKIGPYFKLAGIYSLT